jgi:hypothetical protein
MTKVNKVLLNALILYVKAEKKKLLEKLDGRFARLDKELSLLHEETKRAGEIKTLPVQDQTFDKVELLEKVDQFIELKQQQLVDNQMAGLLEAVKKSDDEKEQLKGQVDNLLQQISSLTQQVRRLGFSGGGGGSHGGNLDRYVGYEVKHAKIDDDNTMTFDVVYGNTFLASIDRPINTIVFKNWPSDTISQRVVVYLQQDATGHSVGGWPANVKWSDGVPPDITVAANAIDCYVFESFDGGQTILGNVVGQNYS